jgi:hypothetical protein
MVPPGVKSLPKAKGYSIRFSDGDTRGSEPWKSRDTMLTGEVLIFSGGHRLRHAPWYAVSQ